METKRWSVLAVALAGCGGGGGGDGGGPLGSVDVTTANQDTLSRAGMVALQAAVLGGSGSVTGGSSGGVARALAGRKQIAAVQAPVIDYCTISGTTTTVLDDRDGSGAAQPTAGDVATITYDNCSEVAGEVTSGTIVATYTQVQLATLPATIAANVTTTDLRTQTSNASVTAQGGFAMTLRIDGLTAGNLRVAVPGGGAFAMDITTPLYSDTVTLRAGYVLDSAYDGTAPARTTTTARGQVGSGVAAGYVQVNTLQPFVQYNVDPYPRSGQFEAVGKTGSLQALVLSTSQVQLDLDADGNGSFEASKTVAWSDFF